MGESKLQDARREMLEIQFTNAHELLQDIEGCSERQLLIGAMHFCVGDLTRAKDALHSGIRLARGSHEPEDHERLETIEYLLIECDLKLDWTVSSRPMQDRIERFCTSCGVHPQRQALQTTVFLKYAVGCGDLPGALCVANLALPTLVGSTAMATINDIRSVILDLLGDVDARDAAFDAALASTIAMRVPLSKACELARLAFLADHFHREDMAAELERLYSLIPGECDVMAKIWQKTRIGSDSVLGALVS